MESAVPTTPVWSPPETISSVGGCGGGGVGLHTAGGPEHSEPVIVNLHEPPPSVTAPAAFNVAWTPSVVVSVYSLNATLALSKAHLTGALERLAVLPATRNLNRHPPLDVYWRSASVPRPSGIV